MNIDALRAADNKHVWHPYTDQVTFETEPYTCIERGEVVYLHTVDGRKLYDGIASWATCPTPRWSNWPSVWPSWLRVT